MPKASSSSQKRRHNPLEDDLVSTGVLKNREGRPSKRANKKQAEEQAYVDAKSSRKILAMSRDLIDEGELERGAQKATTSAPSAFDFDPSRLEGGSDQEEEEFTNEEAWGDEEDVVEEIEVDAADLETFNRFITPTMNEDPLLAHGWDRTAGGGEEDEGPGVDLADLILAKIAEKEAMQDGPQELDNPVDEEFELPPMLVEIFTKYVWGRAHSPMGDCGANKLLGSGCSSLGTSLGRCPSFSRSCLRSPTGRTSSRSHGPSHGMCRLSKDTPR